MTRKVIIPKRVSFSQRLTTFTTRSSKPKRPITYKNKKLILSLKIRSGLLFKYEILPDTYLSPQYTGNFFRWDTVKDVLNKVKKNIVTFQGMTGGKD